MSVPVDLPRDLEMTFEKAPKAALLVLLLALGLSAPSSADPREMLASPVQVFTGEELTRQGVTDVADLIDMVPKVDLSGTATGQIDGANLRGVDHPTQVLVNGVRSPTPEPRIPLDQLERIEILSGGASALYGSQAHSGVINLTTKEDYEGVSRDTSPIVSEFLSPLSRLWVGTEYGSDCNATNGVIRPFWSLWFFGSESRGFSGSSASATGSTSSREAQGTDTSERSNGTLELNVSYSMPGDDGAISVDPAPDVRVNVLEYNYDVEYGLPWGRNSLRDTDRGADKDGQFKITAADGTAILNLDALEIRLGWEALTESYELSVKSDLGLGLDSSNRNVRIDTVLEKTESLVQGFAGQGVAGNASIQHVPTGLFARYVNDQFSIGVNDYVEYVVPEYGGPDLSPLYSMPGQTSIEINTCGDSALPPNGLGYLGQATSPVQSVEDQWALEHVGLTEDVAVSQATSSDTAPIVIGVIDTGLDWNHLDFAWENIWRNEDEIPDNGVDDDGNGFVDDIIGWDFMNKDNKPWDNDGHGTFVSGMIAATHNNGTGIDGINPNARVMVLKALNNFGRTRASYVAQAIVYGADNGAKILNVSVSGGAVPGVVIDALAYARAKGVLVITAAGNRGENIDRGPPGGVPGVMSVAATGPDDKRAIFSNVGSSINIAAPGVDIVSLRARQTDFMLNSATTTYQVGDAYLGEDKRYYRSAGTSFATPIVSGIASLVWSNRPELTAMQVQRILEQSARDVETPGRDRFTGYGVVDAKAALAADPEFFVDAAILEVRPVEEDERVFVQIFGSADASQFGRAWLEIGEGEDPSLWILVGDALPGAVRLGVLGRIPADQLDGAKVWTVRVISEHQNGRQQEARYVIELG
jgi:hypothetical protein